MNHRHKQQIRKRSVECLINKSLASLNHQHEMATGPQGTNSSVSRFVVSLWVIQLCLDGSDRCHASEVSTIEFIPVENLFIEQLEGDMPKFSANVCVCALLCFDWMHWHIITCATCAFKNATYRSREEPRCWLTTCRVKGAETLCGFKSCEPESICRSFISTASLQVDPTPSFVCVIYSNAQLGHHAVRI